VRTAVTAFLLGAAAVAALALGSAIVAVVLADASGRDVFRVALGELELLSFERRADGSETAFGPALLALPLIGGLLNAVAAAVLQARRGRAQ
jgi:hypothetical protein